jgi:hypothetical protein
MWDLTLRYHENEQEALEYQNLLQAGFSVGEIGASQNYCYGFQ